MHNSFIHSAHILRHLGAISVRMAFSESAEVGLNCVLSQHIPCAHCPKPYSWYWANRVGQICGPRSIILEQSEDAEGNMSVTCSLDASTDATVRMWASAACC